MTSPILNKYCHLTHTKLCKFT